MSEEKSPLAELDPDVQARIVELKDKGNPVNMVTIAGEKYVYYGLLREDIEKMQEEALEIGTKMAEGVDENTPDDVKAKLLAKLESIEETYIIVFAVISPKLTLEGLRKFPNGRIDRLRTLILSASGNDEEMTAPIKL